MDIIREITCYKILRRIPGGSRGVDIRNSFIPFNVNVTLLVNTVTSLDLESIEKPYAVVAQPRASDIKGHHKRIKRPPRASVILKASWLYRYQL